MTAPSTHGRLGPAAPPRGARSGRGRAGIAFVAAYVVLLIAFGVVPTGYAVYFAFTDAGGTLQRAVATSPPRPHDFRFMPAVGHVALYLAVLAGLAGGVRGGAGAAAAPAAPPGRQQGPALPLLHPRRAGRRGERAWCGCSCSTRRSARSASCCGALGFHTFGQVIAPGHLPILFTVIAFWTGAGGWIVVMYGALNNIPTDVLEAARIDGAGAWQTAWRVQIPMLRKWIVYMVILAFAGGTQLFVEPQLLSQASDGRGRTRLLAQPARPTTSPSRTTTSTAPPRSRWSCWWSAWSSPRSSSPDRGSSMPTDTPPTRRRTSLRRRPARGRPQHAPRRRPLSAPAGSNPLLGSRAAAVPGVLRAAGAVAACSRRPRPTTSSCTATRCPSAPGTRCGPTGTRSPRYQDDAIFLWLRQLRALLVPRAGHHPRAWPSRPATPWR